jgi:hypothetical protein
VRGRWLQVRVSEEELERAHGKASLAGLRTSAWVRKKLEIEDAKERPARGRPERESEYRCPTLVCDFRAKSPAAVCNAHGRKVVESI